MKRALLFIGMAALLVACGKSNGSDNADGSNTGLSAGNSINQKDVEMMSAADKQELLAINALAFATPSSSTDEAALRQSLSGIGDIAARFAGLSSCAVEPITQFTDKPVLLSQLEWNCEFVKGTITSSYNDEVMGSFKRTANISITGETSSAQLNRVISSNSGSFSRELHDSYTIAGDTLKIDGVVDISADNSILSFAGEYNVSKNGGAAEVVTVSSSGVKLKSYMFLGQRICDGSITHASTSGLTTTVTLDACPIEQLPWPGFPGFPGGIPGGIPGGVPAI